jgi:transcriptional regulator with GAF, ATPase, and Fis domain
LGNKGALILADFPLNRRYGRLLLTISQVYSALGDLKNAEMRAYDARASYRRAGDTVGQVDALNELARIALIRSSYENAEKFLDDAIELANGDPRKVAQLMGNAGMIRVLTGHWSKAEADINSAIEYHREQNAETSEARNLLALSYLHLCKREFVFSERTLEKARRIIDSRKLKRESVIYLEFAGEMALEKGDTVRAKSLLTDAYEEGCRLAPESSLISQVCRRLAEAHLALDNHDEAMKFGQKALEIAMRLEEMAEVASAHRVTGLVFAARGDLNEAVNHLRQAVDIARKVGDPLALARSLLALAEIKMTIESERTEKVRTVLDEAHKIFRRLRVDYWVAETDFKAGVFLCQKGDLARGFKKLSRAEKSFHALSDSGRVRKVHQFLTSLADQAVALSISQENEFKVFTNLVNQADLNDLKSGHIEDVLQILLRRAGANRTIIYTPDFEANPIMASFDLTPHQARKFAGVFSQLLGEEIHRDRPTLLLDCRRDPYINELLPDFADVVASVMVIPFSMSDKSTSYIYLDKLAEDNMLNPFGQSDLNFAVGFSDIIAFKSAELHKVKLQEDNRRLKAQLLEEAAFPNFITRSSQVLEMLAQVRQVVDSNISIAIEGETGSGKDLLARAIHYNSNRRDKRFISVNCAALPETLLESELFGYHRGAFTGADRDKPGLFEEADGGTFFLDEVADMPASIQAKLLRVLESKELVRLGESVPRKIDVRIVSATNKDFKELMAAGQFRSDLYYRLSALTFRLSPLRERKEDIPLLVDHFLEGTGKRMSRDVQKALLEYEWPGNVRELENEVKKLVLLAGDNDEIGVDLLSNKIALAEGQKSIAGTPTPTEELSFREGYSLYDYLQAHERRFIIRALKERNGVKKHAAAMLNIPESTLRLKIKQYNIDLNQLDSIH